MSSKESTVSRARTSRSQEGPAVVRIKRYDRPSSADKKPRSGDSKVVTFLPEMPIPEDVMMRYEYELSRRKGLEPPRKSKSHPKKSEDNLNIDENFMDIKNKITEMGSKLKEVEGKLAQRSMPKVELLRKPSKSDSHFNIHDKGPTQMYKPGGYSESIGERPPRMVFHTSIIPETTLKNTDPLRASRITSSAEVDKVIRSIRTEIENWKKKKLNFQGKLNFDEEITSDMPAADIREEAERDAERP